MSILQDKQHPLQLHVSIIFFILKENCLAWYLHLQYCVCVILCYIEIFSLHYTGSIILKCKEYNFYFEGIMFCHGIYIYSIVFV